VTPCGCCSRIYRAKLPNAEEPGEARYVWTMRRGNEVLLCVPCCALWRENAVEDPSLEPLRITELGAPAGSS
jgi:hypothetical protein